MHSSSLNSHIRSDKKNQLGLRTEMRQSDLDVIKDAGRGVLSRDSVRHLKAKVERDPMYHLQAVSVPNSTSLYASNINSTVNDIKGTKISVRVPTLAHTLLCFLYDAFLDLTRFDFFCWLVVGSWINTLKKLFEI